MDCEFLTLNPFELQTEPLDSDYFVNTIRMEQQPSLVNVIKEEYIEPTFDFAVMKDN